MAARRRRRRPIVKALAAAVAFAGCTGGSGKAPDPSASITTAGPPLGEFAIGKRVALPNGDTVQVFEFLAAVTPSNQFSKPAPGSVFAVIDVEGCAGNSPAPDGILNPFFFHLNLRDRSTVPAGIPVKEPALTVPSLASGDCSRGFVTFEVPEGVAAQAVTYDIPTGSIRWKL
jgi:hypothetical protein